MTQNVSQKHQTLQLSCAFIILDFYSKMFKSLVTLAFGSNPTEVAQDLIKKLEINAFCPLPSDYIILFQKSCKQQSQYAVFRELIKQSKTVETATGVIKYLTLVCKIYQTGEYCQELLECLQQIEVPQKMQQMQVWLKEVWTAMKSYLRRLSCMHQLMKRCLICQKSLEYNIQQRQTDLFLIINLYSLLFPALNNALNTIGRYYFKNSPYFKQFYKVIRDQLMVGYIYMQQTLTFFTKQYKKIVLKTLSGFIQSISSIQLLCDQAEEFLMNKYFKGKAPNKKIYFKEEEIEQIKFYIKSHKNAEMAATADQDFGDFQSK